MDETEGGGIVKDDACGRLWETHFVESGSEWDGFFAVAEGSTNFAIGSGRGNMFEVVVGLRTAPLYVGGLSWWAPRKK